MQRRAAIREFRFVSAVLTVSFLFVVAVLVLLVNHLIKLLLITVKRSRRGQIHLVRTVNHDGRRLLMRQLHRGWVCHLFKFLSGAGQRL